MLLVRAFGRLAAGGSHPGHQDPRCRDSRAVQGVNVQHPTPISRYCSSPRQPRALFVEAVECRECNAVLHRPCRARGAACRRPLSWDGPILGGCYGGAVAGPGSHSREEAGSWSPPTTPQEIFDSFAKEFESRSPAAASVLIRSGRDPLALSLIPENPLWDVPHRLIAAVRWLVLEGRVEDFESAADPWGTFRTALTAHGPWIANFIREQPIQTNVVQRCWALLPLFLTVARAVPLPMDLIELGTSGGLNLVWDRYHYRYVAGDWGSPRASVSLRGDERAPVPGELLNTNVTIARRRGIDLNPIDVTSVNGLRLLQTFAREEEYTVHLKDAIAELRKDPPELIRGDYLLLLPDLLRARRDDTLTVVFQTLSTVYLTDEQRLRLRSIIETAAVEGPLAWISTPTPDEQGQPMGDYPLEMAIWPGSERRIAARMNVRGEWLEWIG